MMNISDETAAVIALALHLYSADSVHDIESGVITFEPDESDWGRKFLVFRKSPER